MGQPEAADLSADGRWALLFLGNGDRHVHSDHAQLTEETLTTALASQLAARQRTWTVDEYLTVHATLNPLIDITDPPKPRHP